jgi:hypothetical protein
MNHDAKYFLQKYRKMSGEKKVRIGLSLSKLVRKVRKAGILATQTLYGS